MPLNNCEVNLILTWSKNCVLTDMTTQDAVPAQEGNPTRPAINASTGSTFKTTDTKLYVPIVTLSTQEDNKLLRQLKTGFNWTIKWNKYRLEMSNKTKNNNLNYLIDTIFIKVNRLIVLSFETEDYRVSYSKCYAPNVEIKDFNVLIDKKSFFWHSYKN